MKMLKFNLFTYVLIFFFFFNWNYYYRKRNYMYNSSLKHHKKNNPCKLKINYITTSLFYFTFNDNRHLLFLKIFKMLKSENEKVCY